MIEENNTQVSTNLQKISLQIRYAQGVNVMIQIPFESTADFQVGYILDEFQTNLCMC